MAPTDNPKPRKKKPHHIPHSELDLPSLIAERDAKDPKLLLNRTLERLKGSRQFQAWCILMGMALWAGYGAIMLIVGIFWAMISNLGTGERRKGVRSAYSIFNEDGQGIAGSTDMQALDRELRTRGM